MKIKMKIIKALATILLVLSWGVSPVLADELAVTDNGANSNNQINLTNNQQTTVAQSNQANTNTSVTSEANTGSNSVSDNNGGSAQISTGNSTTNTTVENSANTSQASLGCGCPSDATTNVTVSGNSADSSNNVNLTENSQTTVVINQNSTIYNNISGVADTGHNSANFDSGNVSIETGNISADNKILNIGINQARVGLAAGFGPGLIKIAGNSFGNDNQINLTINNGKDIYILNNSDLINILNFYGNTGGNSADFNSGNVFIKTGDIALKNIIENKANLSEIIVNCGCKENSATPPSGGSTNSGGESGSGGSSGGSGSGGGSGGGGETLGSTTGPGLPATGDNAILGYTLLSLLMLGAGIYFRTQPKIKPAYALRFRYNTLHLAI